MVLALSGCSRSVQSAAVGKWQVKGTKETMEFHSNGTCQGTDRYGRTVTGKFAFIDADHIKLELTTSSVDKASGVRSVDHGSGVAEIAVQGDSLDLIDEDGPLIHYQRVRAVPILLEALAVSDYETRVWAAGGLQVVIVHRESPERMEISRQAFALARPALARILHLKPSRASCE